MIKEFTFDINGQKHDAAIIAKDPAMPPTFVLIHGAGVGTKKRIYTYSDFLTGKGLSLLVFDQSGAGKDSINLRQSSLERRTFESKTVIERFAAKTPLTISGSSMGAEIALRMLEYFPVKSLVLFCPAIYDKRAYKLKFGDGFTEAIRRPESWRDSATIPLLRRFTGKLLIIIGEQDEVIPPEVIDLLIQSSPNASKQEIIRLPGCPHQIHTWLLQHPDIQQQVSEKVAQFSL